MGLDTVEMTKQVFDVSVKEGDTVKAGQLLATVDWKTVENEGKGTTIVVVFTNTQEIKTLELSTVGEHKSSEKIGQVSL